MILTAPFVDAIDRLKVGLYLKQLEAKNSGSTDILLPLNFVSKNNCWNLPDNLDSEAEALVADTVALNLARYIPHSETAILKSSVIPLLQEL